MDKEREIRKNKGKSEMVLITVLIILIVIFTIIGINRYTKLSKVNATTKANASTSTNENMQVDTNFDENEIGKTEEIDAIEQNEISTNEIATDTKVDELEAKKKNDEEYEKLKKKKKVVESPTYYIKVNYKAQVVTIYKKDSKGKYTKPVKAMVCSTGTYTPTSGTYRTLGKGNWWGLYGDVYGQYATHIVGGILFHSVPYKVKGDRSSLKYNAYDQLGSRVSMGCVRLTVADAKWIYDNCSIGTQVEFYASSNPGPLGKPSAKKISSAPKDVRGWDPTDPNKNNPWSEYLKSLKNKDKDKNNNNNNNKDNNTNKDKTENKGENKNEDENQNNNQNKNDKEDKKENDTDNTGKDDKPVVPVEPDKPKDDKEEIGKDKEKPEENGEVVDNSNDTIKI